jgi:hypothetical protein
LMMRQNRTFRKSQQTIFHRRNLKVRYYIPVMNQMSNLNFNVVL